MNKKFVFGALALVCALMLPACGSNSKLKTEGVSGVVTLDGEPLADANVYFSPVAGGNSAVARTDAKGFYQLQTAGGAAGAGTTEGTYKVFFKHEAVISPQETVTETNEDGEEVEVVKEAVTENDLPEMYGDPETSGFTVDVVKGKNSFYFDLKSE